MEKKALLFIVAMVVIIGAVYLAFPLISGFLPKIAPVKTPTKPVVTEFFFQLDPATSTLSWAAGEYSGSLNLRFGEIGRDKEGKIAGVFAVDMTSLKASDSVVETRLKSKEFFEINRFTNAELAVTELNYFGPAFNADGQQVESYELRGDLTVRGVVQNIKVPLLLSALGNKIVARGDFNLNREQFLLGPRDPQIPNDIKVTVKLVSKEPGTNNNQ